MTSSPRFLVVGAGLTGATIARILADAGFGSDVIEETDHVAGHCHTSRDDQTGIMMHRHGPHTLHSDKDAIWAFLERFATIHPYKHRKQAWAEGRLFPMPINLQTLCAFFEQDFTPETARAFLSEQALPIDGEPQTFEEAGLSRVGPRLYNAFYRGYTIKQWGRQPGELPAFVFGRLPIRFESDRNVYHHGRQGQPVGGYTAMVERMLDHPAIRVTLGRAFDPAADRSAYHHVFYSGPIDRFFEWRLGRLAYRTLDFEVERGTGLFQDCGTVNYCDLETPWTRVCEHKHFSPWEEHAQTVYSREFSREATPRDAPYYPIPLAGENTRYGSYVDLAQAQSGVSFVGRLGTYRYLDMDVAIGEAMDAAQATLAALSTGLPLPAFFVRDLSGHV